MCQKTLLRAKCANTILLPKSRLNFEVRSGRVKVWKSHGRTKKTPNSNSCTCVLWAVSCSSFGSRTAIVFLLQGWRDMGNIYASLLVLKVSEIFCTDVFSQGKDWVLRLRMLCRFCTGMHGISRAGEFDLQIRISTNGNVGQRLCFWATRELFFIFRSLWKTLLVCMTMYHIFLGSKTKGRFDEKHKVQTVPYYFFQTWPRNCAGIVKTSPELQELIGNFDCPGLHGNGVQIRRKLKSNNKTEMWHSTSSPLLNTESVEI